MKHLIIFIALFGLLAIPQLACASDLEDLKAADARMMKAFTSLDAATIASMIYPGAVSFQSVFPLVAPNENTEAQLTTMYKNNLGSLEFLNLIPYNTQYKVVGNTGIVWGHATSYVKPKGEKLQTKHVRMTSTWVKSDGKWLVLMAHTTVIQQED